MMPKSAKGGGRNRAQKKAERYSVPITVQPAAKLKAVAKGRAGEVPLLLQSDGSPWDKNPGQNYHRAIIDWPRLVDLGLRLSSLLPLI